MITLTENVKIVPHFEIEPKYFRKDKNEFKAKKKNNKNKKSTRKERKKQAEQEKLAYWEESLQQSGIENVPLFIPNGWHVALGDINHDALYEYILRVRRKDSSAKNNIWAGIFHSGLGSLSLCVDNEIIYQATCCSDLSNIEQWKIAVNDKNIKWEMLWNGHPWLYTRYEDGLVRLTGLTEKDRPPDDGKYAISRRELKFAVTEAEKEIADFQKRIIAYWNDNKDNI